MNLYKKKLILVCILGVAFRVNALPLSQPTAEQFYKYNDFENMIKLKEIDNQKYTNYAINKVESQLQGNVIPELTRQQAVKEIEIAYKNFVESKVNQIQEDAIQQYKSEFSKLQTEESVKHQINFYQSNKGKNILLKQPIRRNAIQSLQKSIPIVLASQPSLQAAFNYALQGSN